MERISLICSLAFLAVFSMSCSKNPTPSALTLEFSIDEAKECRVTANWTICADVDFLSYTLYRSTTPEFTNNLSSAEVLAVYQDQNQCFFVDEGLDLGSTYYYAVRVSNSAEKSSWSPEVEIEIPAYLLTYIVEGTTVSLEWAKCPSLSTCNYTLYRSYSSGISGDTLSSTKLGVLNDTDILSFHDSTSTHQTAYYSVRAEDELGSVYWSNELSAFFDFDSFVVAWGAIGVSNIGQCDLGQCDIPEPNTDFIIVSAGSFHSLGLKADGSIVAWGATGESDVGQLDYGQCDIPEPNTGFIAVSAGAYHGLGLKADGSIVAWGAIGESDAGQCDIPELNTGFIAVSAGGFHSLGLKADGSIVAWGAIGEFDVGQCDIPEPNTGFVAIEAGYSHSLGLKADGSIVVWGISQYGQCDIPEPNTGFIAVTVGFSHSLGLKADSSIVAWGATGELDFGQCDIPEPNTGFIAVSAGSAHSLGLKADGSIMAWGATGELDFGQCDIPEPNTGFIAVSAGGMHSLAIRSWVP